MKARLAAAPLAILFFGWLLCVAAGSAMLHAYAVAPGQDGQAPAAWPTLSRLRLDAARPTLILFAHPRCPCLRASLEELSRILARCPNRLNAQVAFFVPPGAGADWLASAMWERAAAIPGLSIFRDTAAVEAIRFHAATTGQVLLYDPAGHLVFAGGITPERGMAGDNAGESAILAFLDTGAPTLRHAPAYGCAIYTANCRKKP